MIWRLAILLLPWQTRWFSDASLAGWPWEQGRLAFYLSWIPMLVLIIRAFCHPRLRRNDNKWIYFSIGTLVAISAVSILRDHAAFRPILQWWVQVSVLALFVVALWRAKISSRSVATWVVISMIPHALIGVWQFASQQVIGNKWLGMASQLPQTLGVSVIAHDGLRILRAYGGFPHPNIFGGWLAVGSLLAIWLAATSHERRAQWIWTLIASLFASVLVLTFSRAAWLGAAAGFVTSFVGATLAVARAGTRPAPTRMHVLIFLFPILVLSFVIFSQRQHIFARFDLSQRLEQKSVDQRVGSLRTGLDLFLKHPLIGSGPNAELLIAPSNEKARAPLEPPHHAYLLALDDVGIVGFVTIVFLIWMLLLNGERKARPYSLSSIVYCLSVLALFDHYLWSTWSGQVLVAIAILLVVEPKTDP